MFNSDQIKKLWESFGKVQEMIKDGDAELHKSIKLNRTSIESLVETKDTMSKELTSTRYGFKNALNELLETEIEEVEKEHLLVTHRSLRTTPYSKLDISKNKGTLYCSGNGFIATSVQDALVYNGVGFVPEPAPVYYYLIQKGFTARGVYRRNVRELSKEDFERMSGGSKLKVKDETK